MAQILCVEDNELEARGLVALFAQAGRDCDLACNGEDALDALRTGTYSVAVVDWNLPGELSGLDLCQRARAEGLSLGILFLTGRGGTADKLDAFGAGADDYMEKPAEPAELCARVLALLRRYDRAGQTPVAPGAGSISAAAFSWGPFVVRLGERVLVDGVERDLTQRQERLLTLLIRNVGRIVTNAEIWEDFRVARAPDLVNIRALVYSLRKRLGDAARFIQTFDGEGYGIGVASGAREGEE